MPLAKEGRRTKTQKRYRGTKSGMLSTEVLLFLSARDVDTECYCSRQTEMLSRQFGRITYNGPQAGPVPASVKLKVRMSAEI